MEELAYFDLGTLKADFEQGEENTIVKDALLLIEGTHKDNNGKTHNFTSDRILNIAHNTNKALAKGVELPFMRNHSKKDDDKIGEVVSDLQIRKITKEDLPNKKQTHLLGRLGAFAKVEVREAIDKVKNKTIRLLSPGIDPVKDVMIEISSVAFPAIQGLSLFSNHGYTSYREAKEQLEASAKLKRELQECFDVFWGVVLAINSDKNEGLQGESNFEPLLEKAVDDYAQDLADKLGIEIYKTGVKDNNPEKSPYSLNPYSKKVIEQSKDNKSVVNFNRKHRRKKRRTNV